MNLTLEVNINKSYEILSYIYNKFDIYKNNRTIHSISFSQAGLISRGVFDKNFHDIGKYINIFITISTPNMGVYEQNNLNWNNYLTWSEKRKDDEYIIKKKFKIDFNKFIFKLNGFNNNNNYNSDLFINNLNCFIALKNKEDKIINPIESSHFGIKHNDKIYYLYDIKNIYMIKNNHHQSSIEKIYYNLYRKIICSVKKNTFKLKINNFIRSLNKKYDLNKLYLLNNEGNHLDINEENMNLLLIN